MNREQRQEAIFGAFDGVVSILGFMFGMAVHKSPEAAMAIGGLGGSISAGISMGVGEVDEGWRKRLPVGLAMFIATLVGSLVPVWPFFFFPMRLAGIIGGVGSLLVATWIGYAKRDGWRGYVTAYATLALAAALTLVIVSLIPQSAA